MSAGSAQRSQVSRGSASRTHAARTPEAQLSPPRSLAGERFREPSHRSCPCGGGCGRCAGARSTSALPIQAKLSVSQPGDPYEQEADRFAESLGKATGGSDVRAGRFNAAAAAPVRSTPEIDRSIERQIPGGSALGPELRKEFEKSLGHDLGGVRIHADPAAHQSASALQAQAFTVGQDVFFAVGKYQPSTPEGRGLLAHELAHTVQQKPRGRIFRAPEAAAPLSEPTAQKEQEKKASGPIRPPTADYGLMGKGTFEPDEGLAAYIESQGEQGADVPVSFGQHARGSIRVRRGKQGFETLPRPKYQSLEYRHPAFARFQKSGVLPVLALQMKEGDISGFLSLKVKDTVVPSISDFNSVIRDNPTLMGWLGVSEVNLSGVTNELTGGKLTLKVSSLSFQIGGWLAAQGELGFENEAFVFDATADLNDLKGIASTQIHLTRDEEGAIRGDGNVAVNLENFSGTLAFAFEKGVVQLEGDAQYSTEKMNGKAHLVVSDAETARSQVLAKLGPLAIANLKKDSEGRKPAEPDTPAKPGLKPGKRAIAGWGDMNFAFTDWLTGTATVVIDAQGHVTVVGKIEPPKSYTLFEQKAWDKEVLKVEARALYGVPLLGNVFVFANIGLSAKASIGAGILDQISIEGVYSTDPEVMQQFDIAATLHIPAQASLTLGAEGGAGVQLVGHDVKAGVGVSAQAGVVGEASARPKVGYREKADPKKGKKGEFYLHGHMQLLAAPFLRFAGELFVEVHSPWWSPVPSHKWPFPVGEMTYLLPGKFGIGADVDYVLGSGQWPQIEFAPVDFNGDQLVNDVMGTDIPKATDPKATEGAWKDMDVALNPAKAPPASNKKTKPPATPRRKDSRGKPPVIPVHGMQKPEQGKAPKPEVEKKWQSAVSEEGALIREADQSPLDETELRDHLHKIEKDVPGAKLTYEDGNTDWLITLRMNPPYPKKKAKKKKKKLDPRHKLGAVTTGAKVGKDHKTKDGKTHRLKGGHGGGVREPEVESIKSHKAQAIAQASDRTLYEQHVAKGKEPAYWERVWDDASTHFQFRPIKAVGEVDGKSTSHKTPDNLPYMIKGDNRGHVIARQLGGKNSDTDFTNFIPMLGSINKSPGKWRHMEIKIDKLLEAGFRVTIEIIIHYKSAALRRPSSFTYVAYINDADGQRVTDDDFIRDHVPSTSDVKMDPSKGKLVAPPGDLKQ